MNEMKKFVSPEYRSKCIEWALRTETEPKNVIEAAKAYYAYVYEDGAGTTENRKP